MLTELQCREVWKDVNTQLGDDRFFGIARDKHEIYAMIVAADAGRLTYPFSPRVEKTVEMLCRPDSDPHGWALYQRHNGKRWEFREFNAEESEALEKFAHLKDQSVEERNEAEWAARDAILWRPLTPEEKAEFCKLSNVKEEKSDRLLHELIIERVKAKGEEHGDQ